MDFFAMKRKRLQSLCKQHGIPANLKNIEMANRLTLLLKEDGNPKTEVEPVCKNLEESEMGVDSEVQITKVKKVKFSPENETFYFVGTDKDSDSDCDYNPKKRKGGNRKSMAVKKRVSEKKQVQLFENSSEHELSVEIIDFPGRVTRSSGQKMVKGDEEEPAKGDTRKRRMNTDLERASKLEQNVKRKEENVVVLPNSLLRRSRRKTILISSAAPDDRELQICEFAGTVKSSTEAVAEKGANLTKPLRRSSRKTVATKDIGEIASCVKKDGLVKQIQEPTLEKEGSLIVHDSLNKKLQRRSSRIASEIGLVASTGLTAIASRKNKKSESRTSIIKKVKPSVVVGSDVLETAGNENTTDSCCSKQAVEKSSKKKKRSTKKRESAARSQPAYSEVSTVDSGMEKALDISAHPLKENLLSESVKIQGISTVQKPQNAIEPLINVMENAMIEDGILDNTTAAVMLDHSCQSMNTSDICHVTAVELNPLQCPDKFSNVFFSRFTGLVDGHTAINQPDCEGECSNPLDLKEGLETVVTVETTNQRSDVVDDQLEGGSKDCVPEDQKLLQLGVSRIDQQELVEPVLEDHLIELVENKESDRETKKPSEVVEEMVQVDVCSAKSAEIGADTVGDTHQGGISPSDTAVTPPKSSLVKKDCNSFDAQSTVGDSINLIGTKDSSGHVLEVPDEATYSWNAQNLCGHERTKGVTLEENESYKALNMTQTIPSVIEEVNEAFGRNSKFDDGVSSKTDGQVFEDKIQEGLDESVDNSEETKGKYVNDLSDGDRSSQIILEESIRDTIESARDTVVLNFEQDQVGCPDKFSIVVSSRITCLADCQPPTKEPYCEGQCSSRLDSKEGLETNDQLEAVSGASVPEDQNLRQLEPVLVDPVLEDYESDIMTAKSAEVVEEMVQVDVCSVKTAEISAETVGDIHLGGIVPSDTGVTASKCSLVKQDGDQFVAQSTAVGESNVNHIGMKDSCSHVTDVPDEATSSSNEENLYGHDRTEGDMVKENESFKALSMGQSTPSVIEEVVNEGFCINSKLVDGVICKSDGQVSEDKILEVLDESVDNAFEETKGKYVPDISDGDRNSQVILDERVVDTIGNGSITVFLNSPVEDIQSLSSCEVPRIISNDGNQLKYQFKLPNEDRNIRERDEAFDEADILEENASFDEFDILDEHAVAARMKIESCMDLIVDETDGHEKKSPGPVNMEVSVDNEVILSVLQLEEVKCGTPDKHNEVSLELKRHASIDSDDSMYNDVNAKVDENGGTLNSGIFSNNVSSKNEISSGNIGDLLVGSGAVDLSSYDHGIILGNGSESKGVSQNEDGLAGADLIVVADCTTVVKPSADNSCTRPQMHSGDPSELNECSEGDRNSMEEEMTYEDRDNRELDDKSDTFTQREMRMISGDAEDVFEKSDEPSEGYSKSKHCENVIDVSGNSKIFELSSEEQLGDHEHYVELTEESILEDSERFNEQDDASAIIQEYIDCEKERDECNGLKNSNVSTYKEMFSEACRIGDSDYDGMGDIAAENLAISDLEGKCFDSGVAIDGACAMAGDIMEMQKTENRDSLLPSGSVGPRKVFSEQLVGFCKINMPAAGSSIEVASGRSNEAAETLGEFDEGSFGGLGKCKEISSELDKFDSAASGDLISRDDKTAERTAIFRKMDEESSSKNISFDAQRDYNLDDIPDMLNSIGDQLAEQECLTWNENGRDDAVLLCGHRNNKLVEEAQLRSDGGNLSEERNSSDVNSFSGIFSRRTDLEPSDLISSMHNVLLSCSYPERFDTPMEECEKFGMAERVLGLKVDEGLNAVTDCFCNDLDGGPKTSDMPAQEGNEFGVPKRVSGLKVGEGLNVGINGFDEKNSTRTAQETEEVLGLHNLNDLEIFSGASTKFSDFKNLDSFSMVEPETCVGISTESPVTASSHETKALELNAASPVFNSFEMTGLFRYDIIDGVSKSDPDMSKVNSMIDDSEEMKTGKGSAVFIPQVAAGKLTDHEHKLEEVLVLRSPLEIGYSNRDEFHISDTGLIKANLTKNAGEDVNEEIENALGKDQVFAEQHGDREQEIDEEVLKSTHPPVSDENAYINEAPKGKGTRPINQEFVDGMDINESRDVEYSDVGKPTGKMISGSNSSPFDAEDAKFSAAKSDQSNLKQARNTVNNDVEDAKLSVDRDVVSELNVTVTSANSVCRKENLESLRKKCCGADLDKHINVSSASRRENKKDCLIPRTPKNLVNTFDMKENFRGTKSDQVSNSTVKTLQTRRALEDLGKR